MLVLDFSFNLENFSIDYFGIYTYDIDVVGYSCYGKKFDPEPGRCRRTDGKKWRCSKDAYPDSKYCERHMHRGRSRSRKPVESQSASEALSTAMLHISSGNRNSSGSLATSGSGSFNNVPAYSVGSSEALSFGSSITKLQVEPAYGIDNKEYRYLHELTPGKKEHSFSSETSGIVRGGGMSSSTDSTWRLMPSQVSSSVVEKAKNGSLLLGSSTAQLQTPHSFEITDSTSSKRLQQHCFFGNEIGTLGPVKQERHSMCSSFDDWPTTKESWPNLEDDEASNKNSFSTTQLSISIPMAPQGFSSRDG